MSRKAIQGYTEKSYYDNTRFRGIVATNDPLNEGSFKHLVNFDISDTGQSVEARKGFLSTRLNNQSLNKNTIYFLDPKIGKYIFVDFSKYNGADNSGMALISDLTLLNQHNSKCPYYNVQMIHALDIKDLLSIPTESPDFMTWIHGLHPIDTHFARLAYDENSIPRNVIKVLDDAGDVHILSFTYRERDSRFEDHVYDADTLIISYLNFDDTKSIISGERNIASYKSIIPDPMQHIYKDPNVPGNTDADTGVGDISRLPLIYVKDTTDKYILETHNNLSKLTLIPHYILRHENTYNLSSIGNKLESDYEWCYTYDIVSQNKYQPATYRSPIYGLVNNDEKPTTLNKLNTMISKVQNLYNPGNNTPIKKQTPLKECYSKVTWDEKNILSIGHAKNAYVLYLVPSPAMQDGEYIYSNQALNEVFEKSEWSSMDPDPKDTSQFLKVLFSKDVNTVGPNLTFPVFKIDSEYIKLVPKTIYDKLPMFNPDDTLSAQSLETVLDKLIEVLGSVCSAYIVPFENIVYNYNETDGDLFTTQQTSLSSKLLIYKNAPMPLKDAKTYLLKQYKTMPEEEIFSLLVRPFHATYSIDLQDVGTRGILARSSYIKTMFPDILNQKTAHKYYVYIQNVYIQNVGQAIPSQDAVSALCGDPTGNDPYLSYYKRSSDAQPTYSTYYFRKYSQDINTNGSIFTRDSSGILNCALGTTKLYEQLQKLGFFASGFLINFYILYYPKQKYILEHDIKYDLVSRNQQIISTPYQSSRLINITSDKPKYILERITQEPEGIRRSKNLIVFREPQGDRLVTWAGNTVYISEPGEYNYFKYTGKKEYPNAVVKVIQYKDTLLVFTTSDVYSIFPFEDVTTVQDGINDKGEPKYVQVKSIVYKTLPVLYNLMIDEKYKDAIQVFNQMVLFYSADGQMFMIKPTATVDSNTRFSIQYFNKNANDILENYDQYINERLAYYGKDKITKEEVKINVQLSINNIKIFYTVPNVITYILVYDVIKNNYYVYDTISFTEILDILPTSLGDVYITPQDTKLYLTQQYNNIFEYNNNIDMHEHNSNIYNPVITEIDTGVLNLNNHLKKRFKEIQTIYKNLNAQELEFSLEVFVDDIPVYTYYTPTLEVTLNQEHNHQEYKTTEEVNSDALLDTNTVLFNFSAYNSNATISHKTSIISKGKTIRLKFIFKSQGKYKVLGYGLIYKERRV